MLAPADLTVIASASIVAGAVIVGAACATAEITVPSAKLILPNKVVLTKNRQLFCQKNLFIDPP